jgi:hypothetical protein
MESALAPANTPLEMAANKHARNWKALIRRIQNPSNNCC